MDANSIITIAIGVAGTVGGYMGGRKNSSIATETVSMLTTQIDTLKEQVEQIPILLNRIETLEGLVTQRADVETVKQIVTEIKGKLSEAPW